MVRRLITVGVLVIGGGISGLATAQRVLAEAPSCDVLLTESAERPGGTIGTDAEDGFLFERGPNGFLDDAPGTRMLIGELGLRERLRAASPAARHRYILRGGSLLPLPSSPLKFLATRLLSWRGKLRVLSEPFQKPAAHRPQDQHAGAGEPGEHGEAEESVASFGRRRLGAAATATFLDPLVTGVFAGDVERLSLQAAFPRIARMEAEHGSLFKGMAAQAKERRRRRAASRSSGGEPAAGAGRTLMSFAGGLGELIAALARELGQRVRTAAPAVSVTPLAAGEGYQVELRGGTQVTARSLVVATPAPRAATLLGGLSPALAAALAEIPYAPVAVVGLGFRREQVEHPLDGYGFLVPRLEGRPILGVIWTSSIFPEHAPDGTVNLRVLLGGAHEPEVVALEAEELADLALGELRRELGIAGEPVARRVYRYPLGIPQYNVGHLRRLEEIQKHLTAWPGLFLTGNAYRGVGLNDCVADGRKTAASVAAFLAEGTPGAS